MLNAYPCRRTEWKSGGLECNRTGPADCRSRIAATEPLFRVAAFHADMWRGFAGWQDSSAFHFHVCSLASHNGTSDQPQRKYVFDSSAPKLARVADRDQDAGLNLSYDRACLCGPRA